MELIGARRDYKGPGNGQLAAASGLCTNGERTDGALASTSTAVRTLVALLAIRFGACRVGKLCSLRR